MAVSHERRAGVPAAAPAQAGALTWAVLAALALHAAALVGLPGLFTHGPLRSHYLYADKHLVLTAWPHGLPLLATLVLLALALVWLARGRATAAVLTLFAVTVALQWSLAWLEGHRAERLSATLLDPHYGHSEFVVLAAEVEDPVRLAREYESIATADRRFVYARSKPPGQLVVYALCAKGMRGLGLERPCAALAEAWGFHRRDPFTAQGVFDTLLFLLLSATPVLVLARCGSALARWSGAPAAGHDIGLGPSAALAYALLPCVALVTMHLDQVLYPLLVALVLWTTVRALPGRAAWALAAGLLSALAVYVSFSLLVVAGMAAMLGASYGFWSRALEPDARARWGAVARAALGYAVGLAVGLAALRLALGFDLPHAYARAMGHHEAWRHAGGLMGPVVTAHNLAEFAVWLGLPATVALLVRAVRLIRRSRRALAPLEGFTLLCAPFLVAVSVLGHTRSEIGRLWIPLTVPLMLPLADELRLRYGRRPWAYAALAVVAVLLLKDFQDFQ